MSRRSRRQSRRRRLRDRREKAQSAGNHPQRRHSQLERWWARATHPRALGVLLLLSGIILWVTPLMRRADAQTAGEQAGEQLTRWWTSALYAPDMLGICAGLLAAAAILGLGAWWNRQRLTRPLERRGRGRGAEPAPDGVAELDESRLASAADIVRPIRHVPEQWVDLGHDTKRLFWTSAGLAGMLLGAALLVGAWFGAQRGILPADLTITTGESAENYQILQRGKPLKINLARRVRLRELEAGDLEAGDDPRAVIQIYRAGDDPAASPSLTRTLPAGAGVQIEGLRLTFSGIKPSDDKFRALLKSSTPDTIDAAVGVGGTFRLGLDGPSYKVTDISENYRDFMGPAVELESSETGRFWVFQRQNKAAVQPDLGHTIELERLESQLAGIFTVTPSRSFWPMSLGGALLVLGFAVLTLMPERLVRILPTKIFGFSLLDAGRLAEEINDALPQKAAVDAAQDTGHTKTIDGAKNAEDAGQQDGRTRPIFRLLVLLGWVGLTLCVAGIYFGLFKSLSALFLTGAAAGLITMPGQVRSRQVARWAAAGAVVPAVLIIFSRSIFGQISGEPVDLMLLFAASWALFSAALTTALSAASLSVGHTLINRGSGQRGKAAGVDPVPGDLLGLYARDFARRAVGLGWLFWLVTCLIHWRQFGAITVAAPADWMLFGTLILASGALLLLGSERQRRFEPIFVLFIAILALGLYFGAPLGMVS